MAAGDGNRVWFPEMSNVLVQVWSQELSWEVVGELCVAFAGQRQRIREDRGIVSPRIACKCCGELMVASEDISIRSALFELNKREVIDAATLASLDRAWGRYRKAHDLDASARPRRKLGDGCLAR